MTPRPLILRLLGPFTVLCIVAVVVSAGVVWWAGQRAVRQRQEQALERLNALMRQERMADRTELNVTERKQVEQWGQVLGARITLIDGTGKVLADTHGQAATMDNHNTRPEVIEARQKGWGSSLRPSDTTRESRRYVARLLERNRPDGIVVRLSYTRSILGEVSIPLGALAVTGIGVSAILMLLLSRALSRRWVGPVHQLAAAADRMSTGDWKTPVEIEGADDVRYLAGRINVMAQQAQNQLEDLQHERADLRSLVDSLPDPVVLGDAEDRIILINTPAAALLQLTAAQALGRKLGVAINEEAILRVLEDVRNGETIQREIRLQRNGQHVIYQAVAAASRGGGMLLVLRNITALAMTVQMKTDFVANASHELRTPIAAIKAAFETLQDVYTDDPEQTGKCVKIIEGHLKRLEEMLGDLLDLSRVESPDLKPQVTSIKIEDLFAFVRSNMGTMASLKEVELDLTASGDLAEFTGDRHLLELVLKNLVENSLKFTPAGGKVTVSFTSGDDQLVMEVLDTGIGIPPEHQERVFERFYQVDPARSGSAGRGTGLGLAIVKHAVHAMGGTVKLTSAAGVGTKVRCTLPQAGAVAAAHAQENYS